MSSSTIIAFLFRIINFCLLIGLGFYFFRKNILQKIKQTIAQKTNYGRSLHQKKLDLVEYQQQLAREIEQQYHQGRALEAKILQWSQVTAERRREQQKDQEVLSAAARERATLITRERTHKKIEERVVPEAFKNVESVLHDTFDTEKQGQLFINTALDHLKKSVL